MPIRKPKPKHELIIRGVEGRTIYLTCEYKHVAELKQFGAMSHFGNSKRSLEVSHLYDFDEVVQYIVEKFDVDPTTLPAEARQLTQFRLSLEN